MTHRRPIPIYGTVGQNPPIGRLWVQLNIVVEQKGRTTRSERVAAIGALESSFLENEKRAELDSKVQTLAEEKRQVSLSFD